MKKYLKSLLIAFALIIPAKGFCCEAEITTIRGDKYFLVVKDALLRAEKSIYVVMPAIDYPYLANSKVNQLVNALIVNKERGLDIEIILEQPTNLVKMVDVSEWRTVGRSLKVYKRFKGEGINVHYAEPRRSLPLAAIIIDNKRVILGGTKWVEAIVDRGTETNLLINSPELADNLAGYFKAIKVDPGIDAYVDLIGPAVLHPGDLLENPRLMPRMIRNGDEQVFDTYLFLLWKFNGNPAGNVMFAYEELAKYLGIYNGRASKAYRSKIGKVLKKLERKYVLIKFAPVDDENAAVTLIKQGDFGTAYEIPSEYVYGFPVGYFTSGWNRSLSFKAKCCYLINLYCSAVSENKPFWSKSVSSLSGQFGNIGAGIINKGMDELQRKNLIAITYDAVNGPYNSRKPRVYELLPVSVSEVKK